MNYHSNEWIMEQINRHNNFAHTLYDHSLIVGVFCQGSTNYGLDIPNSDIDTKCIVLPSFKDICLAKKPVSTTHILKNNEHLDAKDIRSYVECFRKQNLNFLEILFTDYKIIHPEYEPYWNILIKNREGIARMNPYRAVKSMQGIAKEKYHAMEHRYPAKVDIIDTYGYDPKQVSHLVRVRDYLDRYIAGEAYEKCLKPSKDFFDLILDLKLCKYNLEDARAIARENLEHIDLVAKDFYENEEEKENSAMRELLNEVSYEIMKKYIKNELEWDK